MISVAGGDRQDRDSNHYLLLQHSQYDDGSILSAETSSHK